MNLQKKSILFFNMMLLISCLILGIMGYRSANHGFEIALEEKARADMRQVREILDLAYPGEWWTDEAGIHKGDQRFDEAYDLVDHLGQLTGNNVTVFNGDLRVATTFVKDGQRAVGTKASQEIVNIVLNGGKPFAGEAEVLGNKYFCAYEPIKDGTGKTIGMLFMGIPKAEVENLQRDFLFSSVTATLILLLVIGILVYYAVHHALKPLADVQAAMHRIADGDLGGEPLAIRSSDEIGDISDSANHMQKSVSEILRDIATSSQQVAAASQQLTATATQTSDSIRHVAANISRIAGDTEEQSSSLDEINEKNVNMRQEVSELHESSRSMQKVAENSRAGAKEGHAAVANAMSAMQKMSAQMEESSQVVGTLGERSKEVGKIVEAISSLSEQTNLLALNAAIEAARAGEAGRGFAVVADEVRKLAEQSGTAAQNISQIISGIQNDTIRAMQAMDKGNAEVHAGTKIVQITGEVFSNMERYVDELYEQIQRSQNRINSVDKESASITESVRSVNEFSREMATEAKSVSDETDEQTAMMQDISEASESLAQLAQDLQNEVARFKFT